VLVEGVADLPLQGPQRFFGGLALSPFLVVAGAAFAVVVEDLGDRGHVGCVVQLPVPPPGLLAPVMPTAAFPHDTERPIEDRRIDIDGTAVSHHAAAAWCCAIGVMLLPAVTLPTGLTETGLPVGVQLIGPFLSDLRLLRIAELLDAAAGPGFTPPPLG
jgi:hypothetical protein